MTKTLVVLTTAALALTSLSAFAQTPKMAGHKMAGHKMMGHKSAMKPKMVAYCAQCKMYFSAADAKKMKMMDQMGHKLVMEPMSKVPKSATMGKAGGTM